MSLLAELEAEAVSAKNLSQLLRKCKLLANSLDSELLENWLTYELNGYEDNIEVPSYRTRPLTIYGDFSGPLGSRRTCPIPELCIPEKLKHFTKYQIRLSVAGIEDFLKNPEHKSFIVPLTNLAPLLGFNVLERHNCINVRGTFGRNFFVEILNTVQNKILDFILMIKKKHPEAGDMGEKCIDQKEIKQIFYTTINGGISNSNIVGIANDSMISCGIQTHDLSSLEFALKKQGITSEDFDDLKLALENDPIPREVGKFGENVANWFSKMMGKAATGAWNVGISTASTLLDEAIKKYYGF